VGSAAMWWWGGISGGIDRPELLVIKREAMLRKAAIPNPQSGWQHKAWGEAKRNPRSRRKIRSEPVKWATAFEHGMHLHGGTRWEWVAAARSAGWIGD
jgi:hypothetical protein